MSHLLLYYQRPEPATWVFLSSFLLLSIYLVFHRIFSVRNLDILLLLLLAPGLMMVYEGRRMRIAQEAPIATTSLAGTRAQSQVLQSWTKDSRAGSISRPDPVQSVVQSQVAPFGNLSRGKARPEAGSQQSDSGSAASEYASSQLVSFQTDNSSSPIQELGPIDPGSSDMGTGNTDVQNELAPISGYQEPVNDGWTPNSLEFYGFAALLIACALLLIRMLVDPALVRRPLLIPNLSIGGLSFIGVSLFLFLMANVVTSSPGEQRERGPSLGPGYLLLNMLPALPTTPENEASVDLQAAWEAEGDSAAEPWLPNLARILSIFSNLAIVMGIVGVGYWHFDNVKTGIGCAVMYLLLPYTAQMTGNLEHTVPAAFLVLALLAYRQPLIAGALLGLGAGLVYYPLFLLPLWISFYWKRGLSSFLTGVLASLGTLIGLLLTDTSSFGDNISRMFGLWLPQMDGLQGIWADGRIPAEFRLPILVGCILLSISFVFWPSRKNLGTLMCGTAAIMLAVQFWHGFGGGLYMAWFLPFTLLTVFRPNLDDRIALRVVRDRTPAPKAVAA